MEIFIQAFQVVVLLTLISALFVAVCKVRGVRMNSKWLFFGNVAFGISTMLMLLFAIASAYIDIFRNWPW